MILPYGAGDNPHHRKPTYATLKEYTTQSGDVLTPGCQVEYTGPAMIPEWPHIVTALHDYGSWVEAELDQGAYEVHAENVRRARAEPNSRTEPRPTGDG